MTRNRCREVIARRAQILLLPQIKHRLRALMPRSLNFTVGDAVSRDRLNKPTASVPSESAAPIGNTCLYSAPAELEAK